MSEREATERFSDRVENYIKFRPGYPEGIIRFLESEAGLLPSHIVADLGSGTGILTELFLKHGNQVYGIEPNAKMREAGEKLLSSYRAFRSIAATAEDTTLGPSSVDFVTAGQAFHWFDPQATKREVGRILRPQGYVVLVWNDRKESSEFGREYEAILKEFGTDYAEVAAKYRFAEDPVRRFFSDRMPKLQVFQNEQMLDLDSFRGRILSASYAPTPGHPNFESMSMAMEKVFTKHARNGMVRMEYDTKVFLGRI